MIFERLDSSDINQTSGRFNMVAAGTVIETKVLGFWKKDGTDDKIVLETSYY